MMNDIQTDDMQESMRKIAADKVERLQRAAREMEDATLSWLQHILTDAEAAHAQATAELYALEDYASPFTDEPAGLEMIEALECVVREKQAAIDNALRARDVYRASVQRDAA